MMSVVKTVRITEDNSSGVPCGVNALLNDDLMCVKVFGSKSNGDQSIFLIEPSKTNDQINIGSLEKSFENKLNINKDGSHQEILQISRGPDGGKPVKHGDQEHGPASKFSKPFRINVNDPHFQKYSAGYNSILSNVSCAGIFNGTFHDHEDVKATTFSWTPDRFDSMTVGEVIREKGMNGVEPTRFSLLNPNVVFDEYGRIIQQNNMRKFDVQRSFPQNQNGLNGMSFMATGHNNNPINISSLNSVGPLCTKFGLTIQNFPSTAELHQAQFNFGSSHETRPQGPNAHHVYSTGPLPQMTNQQENTRILRTPSDIPLKTAYQPPRVPHKSDLTSHLKSKIISGKNVSPINSSINFLPSYNSGDVQRQNYSSVNNFDRSNLEMSLNPSNSSSKIYNNARNSSGNISSINQTSVARMQFAHPFQHNRYKTASNFADSFVFGSYKHQTDNIFELQDTSEYGRSFAGNSMNPSLPYRDTNEDQGLLVLPDLGEDDIFEFVEGIRQEGGQINNCQALSKEQQRQRKDPLKTLPDVYCKNRDIQREITSDCDLGLDEETIQNLLQEFETDIFWNIESSTKEMFKKPESVRKAPFTKIISSEVNPASPPESLNSTTEFYDPCHPSSNDSEYPNPHSIESSRYHLESLENMVIHPDLCRFLVQDIPHDLFPENFADNQNPSDSLGLDECSIPCENYSINNFILDKKPECVVQGSRAASLSPCSANAGVANSECPNASRVSTVQCPLANLSDEDLMRQDEEGDNILHVAVIQHNLEAAHAVLTRFKFNTNLLKKIIEAKNELGQTPLCLAVLENQPITVKSLVEYGADASVRIMSRKDGSYTRPLHFAASKGHLHLECLRELLTSKFIDVNSQDSEGKTPLLCAVKGHGTTFSGKIINSIPSIELLVERGADLNRTDGCFDMTPLHYAVASKSFDLVSCLISLASTGCRSFSSACKSSLNETLRGLNNHDVSGVSTLARMLSAKTGTGYSALHLAVSLDMKQDENQLKIIQLLLSRGADPSSKNSEGQLPRELTKNQKVIELLKGIGLRKKTSAPSLSPLGATGSSPGSPFSQSPLSTTSHSRMSSVNGHFSPPGTQMSSPIHQLL